MMQKISAVPTKFDSHSTWQNYWKSEGNLASHMPNLTIPSSKRIQIYSDGVTDHEVISHIMTGVNLILAQTNLPFQLGIEPSSTTLNQAILKSAVGDKINCDLLYPNLNFTNGLILVTSKLHTNPEMWGEGNFYSGVGILSFPSFRIAELRTEKALSYVQIIAKHVATHLIGYRIHHEDSAVYGHKEEARLCNMNNEAPVLDTCTRCVSAVTSFWNGIKEGKK